MVIKYRKAISVILAVLSAIVLTTGCGGTDLPFDLPETIGKDEETEKIIEKVLGQKFLDRGEQTEGSDIVMNAPDVSPDGSRYDEWKGLTYSTDTSFPCRTYWMCKYDSFFSDSNSVVQDPKNIEDGVLEIIDAKAEPIGGEMKLRSGGYVDVTIETRWTGTMTYYSPFNSSAYVYSFAWDENTAIPFDAYTGTALLNSVDSGEKDNDEINIGEAVNTGMVESSVTWQGRTYRLFAKKDVRNASFAGQTSRNGPRGTYVSTPGVVETTLTLRMPADYDGMVLAIDKDITDEKEQSIDRSGNWIKNTDSYADVLTNEFGVRQNPDDYYFVKVSDLLEKFKDK